MQEYLNQRELGELHVSIGTSRALETIYLSRDNEVLKRLRNTTEVWINIRTLLRNIVSSLDRETSLLVTDAELSNLLIDEIEQIQTQAVSINKTIKPIFYYCNYDSIKSLYKTAYYREQKTPKQLFLKSLYDNTLRNIKLYYRNSEVLFFDLDIKPYIESKALFITHYPIDLTNDIHFKEINLVESHTGIIKPKNQWYTKLSSPDKSELIPIRRCMLAIFGDSEIFRPQRVALRRLVLEVAEQYKWSSVTTIERIRTTLNFSKDRELVNELLKIIH